MSEAVEQDYIGLSVSSSSSNSCLGDEKNSVLNLKETELRLGLPGSESPERRSGPTVLFGKSLGAKRGFSDAIDESGKWDLSMDTGSDVGFGKDEVLLAEIGGKEVKGGPVVAVKPSEEKKNAPASKAQVVGWPPIRSFRKNALATNLPKNSDAEAKSGPSCLFVKVSMDGAPYLRKVDLKTYSNYAQLSSALEKLFSCFTIGQCSTDELLEKEGSKENFHGSEHVLTYEDKDGDWMLVGDVPWEMFIGSCKRLRIMRGSEAIGLAPRSTQKVKTQN